MKKGTIFWPKVVFLTLQIRSVDQRPILSQADLVQ